MDGARRGGGSGAGRGRHYAYAEVEQRQPQWQARQLSTAIFSTARAVTAAPPAALPGIAAFLHLQAPRACQYQQRLSNPAGYAPLYDGRIQQRAMASRNHSPTLREFKDLALNTAPSSSRRSITNSDVARMQTSYKPKATTTSRVTTSTSSKTSTSNSNSSLVLRRPVRTSRYLREADRRNILSRIAKGEKQADLAKEYQVSRAAISNLKQRRNNRTNNDRLDELQQQQQGKDESGGQDDDEDSSSVYRWQLQQEADRRQHQHDQHTVEPAVLGATHESNSQSEYELKHHAHDVPDHSNDLASEPEVRSSSPYLPARPANQSPLRDEEFQVPDEMVTPQLLERVTEATSLSRELLFTRLIDQRTDARAFQLALSRTARLLLEHALSVFPTRDVRIPVPVASVQQGSTVVSTLPASCYVGTEATRPICAVTVSECSGSAAALVREFQAIEPHSSVGFVSSSLASRARGGGIDVQVPSTSMSTSTLLSCNIHESNVLVLIEVLDAPSSHHVVQAVQAIQQCGVQQQHIVLVTLCSNERALVCLLQAFPGLRVITSKIFMHDSDSMSVELNALLRSRLLFQEQNAINYEL